MCKGCWVYFVFVFLNEHQSFNVDRWMSFLFVKWLLAKNGPKKSFTNLINNTLIISFSHTSTWYVVWSFHCCLIYYKQSVHYTSETLLRLTSCYQVTQLVNKISSYDFYELLLIRYVGIHSVGAMPWKGKARFVNIDQIASSITRKWMPRSYSWHIVLGWSLDVNNC